MDIEKRLRALERDYKIALSSAVTAKARYLAVVDEPGTTPTSAKIAWMRWRSLEERKRSLALLMAELEALEQIEVR